MGATPDQLKDEIDRTREDLRADVEVLAEHLSPKRVADRQKAALRAKLQEPRVQAGLAAVVALLLLRRRRRRRRHRRARA